MYIKTVIKWTVGALLTLVASLSTQAIAQTSTAPSGPITYLQNDLTGNVILATDASGATVWEERYLPYGGKRLGSSSSQKYGYHQKALDPETGLQYFGARYYDPLSGRFSGMDPLAPTEANIYTFNRYAFANGNPYRYTDPDGKIGIDIVFVAYDVYKLATEGATTTNLIATGLDVASTFGFGFGAGAIYRTARVAEHAVEGVRAVEAGVHTAEVGKAETEVAGLLAKPTLHDHHLFPQQFDSFFSRLGIEIDEHTVTLSESVHLKGVHGSGIANMPGRWNQRWAQWIKDNPNAAAKDVYQQLGRMMDEFGLNTKRIHPYGE